MRLIDADALIEEIKNSAFPQDSFYPRHFRLMKEELMEAPTVDAVPVEWIVEQIKQFKEAEEWAFNEYGETDYWSVALEILIEKWKGKDNGI